MYKYSKLSALDDKDLDRSQWGKPKTTHRNLQAPKAERLVTLWAEGKVNFGRVYDGSDEVDKKSGHEYWANEESCGLWMLHGDDREMFDFHKVENVITSDGVPVHGLKFRLACATVEMEGFCDTERKSTCFLKVSVKNDTDKEITQKISFLIRSDKEKNLVDGADHYFVYQPDVARWKAKVSSTWRQEGEVLTDGKHMISMSGAVLPVWNCEVGALDWELKLTAGESQELCLFINRGEKNNLDYDAEKRRTEQFWRQELARLNKLPDSWRKDPETLKMVRHMVAQMLQHFVYCEGKEYLFLRQGGLRCIGFPGDTMWAFEILARLGDFSDYLEPVFDTYFNVMQQEDGEIVNIGIYWAMVTTTVLFSLGKYCKYMGEAGRRCYDKYRDKAFAGFEWVRRTRRQTLDSNDLVRGLFPPLRACDYVQVYQNWQITDIYNIMNMKPFAELTKLYEDPRAEEVQEEIDQYVEVMRECARPFLETQKDSDELYIPLCPDGNDKWLVRDDYPMYHYPKFILTGVIGQEYSEKIYRWLINSNRSNGVFYGRTIVGEERSVWYISAAEISWFQLWMLTGNRERMMEILDTQREYTVTEEYHMMERIVIGEPYYVPWSPNVSAMSRLLWMMLAVEELDRKET